MKINKSNIRRTKPRNISFDADAGFPAYQSHSIPEQDRSRIETPSPLMLIETSPYQRPEEFQRGEALAVLASRYQLELANHGSSKSHTPDRKNGESARVLVPHLNPVRTDRQLTTYRSQSKSLKSKTSKKSLILSKSKSSRSRSKNCCSIKDEYNISARRGHLPRKASKSSSKWVKSVSNRSRSSKGGIQQVRNSISPEELRPKFKSKFQYMDRTTQE